MDYIQGLNLDPYNFHKAINIFNQVENVELNFEGVVAKHYKKLLVVILTVKITSVRKGGRRIPNKQP